MTSMPEPVAGVEHRRRRGVVRRRIALKPASLSSAIRRSSARADRGGAERAVVAVHAGAAQQDRLAVDPQTLARVDGHGPDAEGRHDVVVPRGRRASRAEPVSTAGSVAVYSDGESTLHRAGSGRYRRWRTTAVRPGASVSGVASPSTRAPAGSATSVVTVTRRGGQAAVGDRGGDLDHRLVVLDPDGRHPDAVGHDVRPARRRAAGPAGAGRRRRTSASPGPSGPRSAGRSARRTAGTGVRSTKNRA